MSKRKKLTDCLVLMKQWDYGKNAPVSPESLSAGSGYMAWWLCEKGHSWQASVNHRHHGTGCPVCTNRIVVKGVNDLETLNPILTAQWNQKKNGLLKPDDVPNGTHRKVWWCCPKGHEWEAEIISRVAGTGCPYCAGRYAIKGVTDLATVRKDLAEQLDTEKNQGVFVSDICPASNKTYWWLCDKEHSWRASANTRLKNGCPICAGKVVLPGFNDLLTLNPTLAKEWDAVKNALKASEVTLHSGKHAWWLCAEGHSWRARIADRQSGNGCPYCSGLKAIPGKNDLATVAPDIAAELDDAKNKGRKAYHFLPQSNEEVWWKCKNGHSWKAPIYRRYNGCGCPFCSGTVVVKGVNDLNSQQPFFSEQWDHIKNRVHPDEVHQFSNKYAWWLCQKGHSWRAIINNRTSKGRGCPYCSGYLAIPGETDLLTRYPELAMEFDYEKNTIDISTVTEYSHKRLWWKCDKGHSWRVAVNARRKGNGCPYCAGKKAIPGETDLLTLAPHLADEYDFEHNTINITDLTLKSNINVWWICERGHSWKTKVYIRAIGCGCPYCAGQKAIIGETDLLTAAPHIAQEYDYKKNTISITKLTLKSNIKVWWVCGYGHSWKTQVSTRALGSGCPYCAGRKPYKPRIVKG